MIHLVKNAEGKFEVATVENGNLIVSSHQGYETKEGCYTNMLAQLKNFAEACYVIFQDDTGKRPKVYALMSDGSRCESNVKAKKKYIQ